MSIETASTEEMDLISSSHKDHSIEAIADHMLGEVKMETCRMGNRNVVLAQNTLYINHDLFS